ncbi:Lysoplasmalogenase [Flavobacterium longum]|uniref:lysoplasmalogenase family protein n=1 Tax=Flavobacterium longum TaxID=1299340 RepID=UPI0039ED8A67
MDEHYKSGNKLVTILTVAYFVVAISEVVSELFSHKPSIIVLKPIMPLLLLLTYCIASDKRNPLYIGAMLLSAATNVLFIPNDAQMLFFGLVVFTVHRILVIVLVFRLAKVRDFIPVAIATVPFLLIFFYMLASSDVPAQSFAVMVMQNILISLLGGAAVSNYVMNDNRRNSWLLICGLLFVALQFIVFIEKYFLFGFSPAILRPIAMGLNAFAFYTFYEFVMAVEKSDDNTAA